MRHPVSEYVSIMRSNFLNHHLQRAKVDKAALCCCFYLLNKSHWNGEYAERERLLGATRSVAMETIFANPCRSRNRNITKMLRRKTATPALNALSVACSCLKAFLGPVSI